jgi:hypothetical protein
MSIEDEIADRVQREMLFPLLPLAPGEAAIRALFIGRRLWEVLESPEGDAEWEERVGKLRADLEQFVIATELPPKYLFLLYHPREGVWEIRSVADAPSIRVLGLFAAKDVFVAGEVALREQLGGWQSREWKNVKRNARAVWNALFNLYRPVITTEVNEVITGAISGRYFKSDP